MTAPNASGDPAPAPLDREDGHDRQAPVQVAVLLILTAGAFFAVLLSLRVGGLSVSWHDTLVALFHYPGSAHASHAQYVVHALRVPRTVVGVGVGMALGVAGALMQGLTRNPLADSGILGINSGAGLGISLAFLLDVTTISGFVWFAFVGAAGAGFAVYALGSIGGGATPIKLTLAGTILATFVGSITATINVLHRSAGLPYRFWLIGSIQVISLAGFWHAAPFLAVGMLIALGSGKALNNLSLGDEVARSLGQRVGLTRTRISLSVVLLAGAAVAVAGPIGLLGLMAPHIARRLLGPDYRWIIPACALLGPAILLLADVAGQVVHRPAGIGVGIVLAVLGGPFFIFIACGKHARSL